MSDLRRLTDDERYEQAMAAAASERRNRPTHLLLVPLGLFCIAGFVLAYAIYAHETTRTSIEQRRAQYNRLVAGVADLHDLETRAGSDSGVDTYGPIPDMLSRMEGTARDAGLEKPNVPTVRTDRTQGAVRQRYVYSNIVHDRLDELLEWIRLSQERVPGLFVHSISLKPVAGRGWSMDITFARWERENAS